MTANVVFNEILEIQIEKEPTKIYKLMKLTEDKHLSSHWPVHGSLKKIKYTSRVIISKIYGFASTSVLFNTFGVPKPQGSHMTDMSLSFGFVCTHACACFF